MSDQKTVESTVEWEIVLSGYHPDIFVVVSAPESATDAELQAKAEWEALKKTYIWSKVRKIAPTQPTPENTQEDAR